MVGCMHHALADIASRRLLDTSSVIIVTEKEPTPKDLHTVLDELMKTQYISRSINMEIMEMPRLSDHGTNRSPEQRPKDTPQFYMGLKKYQRKKK